MPIDNKDGHGHDTKPIKSAFVVPIDVSILVLITE